MVRIHVTIIYISNNYVLENFDFFCFVCFSINNCKCVHVKILICITVIYIGVSSTCYPHVRITSLPVYQTQEVLECTAYHVDTKTLP